MTMKLKLTLKENGFHPEPTLTNFFVEFDLSIKRNSTTPMFCNEHRGML